MTPQHIISQLLEADSQYAKNLELLKKIIYTAYIGRLRINGLPPDNKVALGNYLFDEERMIFDFTRLSDSKRDLFLSWLLDPHQNEKEQYGFSSSTLNDYHGFSSEETLSWWGSLKKWFSGNYSEEWKIADLDISLNYQLTGIEMNKNQNGLMIGFNQYAVPSSGSKYRDPDEQQSSPIGNTKRIYLTDTIVDALGISEASPEVDLNPLNFEEICKGPHPQSVEVQNLSARHQQMHEYRDVHGFIQPKPWYQRLWNWIVSWFVSPPVKPREKVDSSLDCLYSSENVHIYQRRSNHQIIVTEKKPEIENLVFCGGGAKIFAHVGVWKALNEAKIVPKKFAGSSAGAIVALLCYLGYSAEEVEVFFKALKKDHLMYLEFDRKGMSDSGSLKTAIDYIIAKKVHQIITDYKLPYPQGPITFATLEALKRQCPDCGIGDELIVTSTHRDQEESRYFSYVTRPNMSVSEAVTTSACLPLFFRAILIDDEEHIDGGVLNNFPTNVFRDDKKTFLESDFGNNMSLLAVQFDNGTERNTIDNIREPVYRENFLLNFLYRMITGVSDPASGWEKDRKKLRDYASQSIVIDVGDISTSSFSVGDESKRAMFESGYKAAKDHLKSRYCHLDAVNTEDEPAENDELMYSTFDSISDLLSYCAYRGDKNAFDMVNDLIRDPLVENKAALTRQSINLRKIYFDNSSSRARSPQPEAQPTFFGNSVLQEPAAANLEENPELFLVFYPIFLKLSSDLIRNKSDKELFEKGHHSLRLNSLFGFLDHLKEIRGRTHILFHLFYIFAKDYKENPTPQNLEKLRELSTVFYDNFDSKQPDYFAIWNLTKPQCNRILKLFKTNQKEELLSLLLNLRDGWEPMETYQQGPADNEESEEEDFRPPTI